MDEQLTTRQIAEALQVSESSVKRWCDRGIIPMIRTAGGHRRIPLAGFMQYLEETNQEVAFPILDRQSSAKTESGLQTTQISELLARFQLAIENGDEESVRNIVTRYLAQEDSIPGLADDIIAPAFRQMGTHWECGELEVYKERRACTICSGILHEVTRLMASPMPGAPLAIGGTPEGDQYDLSTQLTELTLRQGGWRSSNLGSNLPLETIAAAVADHHPQLLWLSISHIDDEQAFLRRFKDFADGLPAGLSLVLGGRALNDQLRPNLRYTAHCDNMRQLSAFASAITGRRQHKLAAEN